MGDVHEAATRAHGSGRFKRGAVLAELTKRVWFPGIAKDAAKAATKKCAARQLSGRSAAKVAPPSKHVRLQPEPWKSVAIDSEHMSESAVEIA